MDVLDQGSLKLLGIEQIASLDQVDLLHKIGEHGLLKVVAYLKKEMVQEERRRWWMKLPITLQTADEVPIFHGQIRELSFLSRSGRPAVKFSAYSDTIILDEIRKNCSYQMESQTYGELAKNLLRPHKASLLWNQPGRDEPLSRFLMQYQETDWEFIKRLASLHGHPILPEILFPGAKLYIGLPMGREEHELGACSFHIKKNFSNSSKMVDNRLGGSMMDGTKIYLSDLAEEFRVGDGVRFLGRTLVVTEKHSSLKKALWVHDYVLCSREGCRVERIANLRLSGASIKGTVQRTTPTSAQMRLETDGEAGTVESWHIQPVYYAGSGKGYSGQPELGDTQYLYFPTAEEESRFIIGGADAGYEKIASAAEQMQAEDEKEDAEQRKWKEKREKQGKEVQAGEAAGLNQEGSAVDKGGVGDLESRSEKAGGSDPITRQVQGAVPLIRPQEERGSVSPEDLSQPKSWSSPGKQSLSLNSNGIRLLAKKGARIRIGNNGIKVVSKGKLEFDASEIVGAGKKLTLDAKESIYLCCGGSGVLLLPDEIQMKAEKVYLASPKNQVCNIINPDKVEALLAAYENAKKSIPPRFASDGSVIRRDGYDDILYSDETIDYFVNEVYGTGEYEDILGQGPVILYEGWLDDVYGRSEMAKFWDYMSTVDGLQTTLDVLGIVFEPADALNALIYLGRGEGKQAILSGLGAVPLIGDLIGKGAKMGMRTTSDLALKFGKNGNRLLESLEFTYKTTSDQVNKLEKYLDQVLDSFQYEGSGYRYAFAGGYIDDFGSIQFKIADEIGEVQYYRKYMEGGIKGGSGADPSDAYAYQKYKESLVKGDVLENSNEIISGDRFGDKNLINELTKDGSSISDWSKMESQYSYTNEYGTGKIHYYKNLKTGEVSYYDAKMKIPAPKNLKGNLTNTVTDKDGFWILDLDENLLPKGVRP